ncbi:hypothetical protein M427DRAFT_59036 [Gonapodya prolifera JEL478]|uniref:F-box domain-containing protein n=1 Tax=Gonapodya prolifera (strain JEL478) TaxID=1344416 RepID=A0A139A893_GONPJ|nr:hypothetical protein M427DRAFT_59036 [Gonapodya prolifera JEL478]|eukprot:KXS12919.1 hypothetical protein M427DRAFT_59036 [Gonapodya prolifera JEL478]
MSDGDGNRFLDLPTEIITTVLSHLRTDSIVVMSLTCRRLRSCVLHQLTWSDHNLRLEDVYESSETFGEALAQTAGALQHLSAIGRGLDLVSTVVSITLDREYLPINVTIIGRILDNFISLREARFVGCLDSGADFVAMASENARSHQWISRDMLRLLDLSDGEQRVRENALGPLNKNHEPHGMAWGKAVQHTSSEPELILYRNLFGGTSVLAYPLICIRCEEDAAHSWNSSGLCLFCRERSNCLRCKISLDDYIGEHLYVECEFPCIQRAQMCDECRISSGWVRCSQPECEIELCPICSSGICATCDNFAALCGEHSCSSCNIQCARCLKETRCESCFALCGCPRCTGSRAGTCRNCGKRTCTACLSTCDSTWMGCEAKMCQNCVGDHDCRAVRTGQRRS